MEKPGLRDALPQPQQSDTRNDPFWGNLDSSLSAAEAAPPQSAQPAAKRDLDVGLGDVARGVGAGALELVGGIGELARQASNFGRENAGKQGGDYLEQARANMANKLSPLLDVVAGAGDLAASGAESLNDGMNADAKEALGRRLVDETPEGRLTLGDGAGDIDVWAMKMAQGVGSLLPTLAAGGVTGVAAKASIGRAVTASMIKRGVTQEVAEAVAAKAVSKIATGAAVTTGATGSVGSAGVNTRDTVLGMSFDELAASDTFRQSFTRIDQDQQTSHLSDEEKLGLAREETANLASRATMSDAKVWGAAAMGSMMGDAMLFKMLAGKAATGGVLKGAAKGAAGEGISETLEEGVQQYAVNESLNEVAAADIDPMKGVMSSAIEGGLIGMGTGGAVGAVGGARGGKHASQEDGVGTGPVAEPSAPVTEDAAGPAVDPNFASAPLEDGEQAPSASQAEGELNPLGPSASQFDELRDVPAYLRRDDTAARFKGMAADSEVQRALASEFGQSVQELVASQMQAGDQGKSLYERAQAGELGLDPFAGNKSAQQVAMENQRLALPLKDVIFAGDANAKPVGEAVAAPGDHDDQQAGPGPQFRGGERTRWQNGQEGDLLPPEAATAHPAGELPGAVIDGEAREVGTELPHRDVVYGADQRQPDAKPMRGSATESAVGPLQTLRITRKGKPFATEKEAAMASRKGQEMPVPLNGGGFGVAEIAEVERAKAAETTQPSVQQLDDISVTDPNQPSDQPVASVSAETVPAPSATAGEASQLVPAIDTGYREVIPGNQPQAEVSNEPVTPIPAISSERSGDQPGAGDPVATSVGPTPAELAERAGPGDPADGASLAPVPVTQPGEENSLTAPAPAGVAVSEEAQAEQARTTAGPAAAPTPWSEMIDNPDGTITLKGEVPIIKQWAKDNGVKAIPGKGGLVVAKSFTAKVRGLTAPAANEPSALVEAARGGVVPEPTEVDLIDRDLLKEHAGRWKYRSAVGAGWFTSNTKEGAIDRAREAYRRAFEKGDPVPTREERWEQSEREFAGRMDNRFGGMTINELEKRHQNLGGTIADLQLAGRHEMNGNGGRRTGAAVANEGARQAGQEKMDLERYIQLRRDREEMAGSAPARMIEAARSEVAPEPTEAQKEAGNYKKGHLTLQGLDIALENPKGSTRSGIDPDGKEWQSTMAHDYGYIKRTLGADGDHVDVFIGDKPDSETVYVVDQVDPKTGKFDEHKVMMGFADEQAARAGYLGNYEEGWQGLGAIKAMPVEDFKRWVKEGDTTKPVAKKVRMSQQREGLSADDVAQIVSDFRREYKGAQSLDFIVGQTQEDLYGPEGSPEQIGWRDGGYLPGKQQVHLIADSITRRAGRQGVHEGAGGERGVSGDPRLLQQNRPAPRNEQGMGGVERAKAEVVSTLRHEVLGHYGLDTFTPENKRALLQKLSDAKSEKWLAPAWSEISRPEMYGDKSEQHQAEEVFAHLTENELPSRTIQAWNGIKTEFSRMLRKAGLAKGPIKEHELDSLIRAVGEGIRSGKRTRQNIRTGEEVIGKQADEPAKDDKPERIIRFSKQAMAQGNKPAKHLTRKEAELVSHGWFKQYRGASGIKVQIHATQAELEGALGLDAKDGLIRRAAFDDDAGTLHVAADTISDPKRMREILRHEVLAHYGLANVLGDGEYTKLMSRLIQSQKDPSMKPVWDWVNTHYADEDIGTQAEEVVAHLAEVEQGAWGRGWDRVVAMVTRALRAVGFVPDGITAAETRSLIEGLGKKLQRSGPDDSGPDGGKKFSQEDERPALKGGIKMSQTSTAADAAMEKLNLGPKPDIIDKTKTSLNKLRQVDRGVVSSWVDRVIKKANTEVLDALAPIKYAEEAAGITDAADSGYVAARMATGAASTMQATMLYGLPEWKDGVIQRKAGTGEKDALLGIFADLGADLHNWLGWMAGHRAELLLAQGRENLLDANDIAALKGQGKGKEAKFLDAKARWNRLNAATLDLAQEAGLFTKEARAEFESEWYIPFFRESDDGDVIAPFKTKGIANQNSGIKKLKGGEANTNDLLENIFTSTSKLIDASMKNMAAQKTVWNLADTGIIEVIPKPNKMDYQAIANGKDRIMVKLEGEDYMIRVEDPDLYRAMTFFDRKPFGAMVNVAAKAKRLLTAGVTASPEFMLRNFLRDSLSSWAISKDGFRPVIDSIKGVKKTLAMDGSTIDVMFSGASFLGGYVNGNDPEAMADTVRKSLRRKGMTPEQIARYEKSIIRNAAQAKGVVANVWEKYNRYGEAFENANREAVYAAAIKAGKSHAQAAFESKDLMDFSMLGASRTMQVMTQLLPFFNARVQGLGKLTRELRDNPRAIAKRAGMITAASLALLAANWDDERYEELPDWDKDANWHFFVGDQHFRIPKPFEIGVLFGTIPERMVRAMGDKDTGAQFGKAVARAIGDTFALNPTPQIVKPLVESYFNYDSFRGGPIENAQDLAVKVEARYNEQTSLMMRELGEATGMSPKKLEHLLIGYTGTIGGYVMATADGLIRAAQPGESASWRADEIPLVKAVYRGTGPAKSTQHMEEFYRMLNEVNQLKRTVDQYRSEGLTDKANELLEEQGGILKSRRSLSRTQQQVRVVRNKIELIQRDRILSADEKRRRIDELMARRNDLVYQAVNHNRQNWE
ncbi:LPD38 domain-containing protein [Aeromonas veronii]|uniref:LPD38 domain-containing protein n=1 Tax=Aeromonas veronii TaxID=654 RepID=UPI003BA321C5